MKRLLSILTATAIMLSCAAVPMVTAEDSAITDSFILHTYGYIMTEQDSYLADDGYFSYEGFVQETTSDDGIPWQGMADVFLDVECEPSEDDYIDTLANVMSLMQDPALSVTDQSYLDQTLDGTDYVKDAMDMCYDKAFDYLDSKGFEGVGALKDAMDSIVDMGQSASETYADIKDLENMINEYAQYSELLTQIEESSHGDLKEAAAALREGADAVMRYKLENYGECALDAGGSFFGLFKDDVIEGLKNSEGAKALSGKGLSALDKAVSTYSDIKDLAVLAGNITLDTENAAYRTREMKALSEVADAATLALSKLKPGFLEGFINNTVTREDAERFAELAQFLLMTRRRGEYCLYELITEDSGVLSTLFGGEDAVREWYEMMYEYLKDKSWDIAFLWVDESVTDTHRYQVFDGVASTWEEAAAYCRSVGGHLATIGSEAENVLIYDMLQKAGVKSAYFGLYEASEGVWRWVNGEPLIYVNWGGREPNNEGGDENYGMFYYKFSDGSWNDGDFKGTLNGGKAFVCEWED